MSHAPIHTPLLQNPDEGRGSVYMTKAPGGPLVLGPPWDFNEAWGLCCGYPIEGYQNGVGQLPVPGYSRVRWHLSCDLDLAAIL
jgi:hypothetical protein